MIILSLDSGLERTGYAVFNSEKKDFPLTYGCIFTKKTEKIEVRLLDLYNQLETLTSQYQPSKIVIERIFFTNNQKTIINVAQAQGVTVFLAGKNKIEVEFISPLTVKQTIAGYGKADKKAVQKMVLLLLSLKTCPKPDDTVDAIALGMTYLATNKF